MNSWSLFGIKVFPAKNIDLKNLEVTIQFCNVYIERKKELR